MKELSMFVGIDVGSNGSIASYNAISGILTVQDIPQSGEEVQEVIEGFKMENPAILVCIEQVSLWQRDSMWVGKMLQTGKMVSKYTEIVAILKYTKTPHVRAVPMVWQSYLNLRLREEEEYLVRKRRFKGIAQKLFPSIKVTLGNADALLILQFLIKKYSFDREWIERSIPNSVLKTME